MSRSPERSPPTGRVLVTGTHAEARARLLAEAGLDARAGDDLGGIDLVAAARDGDETEAAARSAGDEDAVTSTARARGIAVRSWEELLVAHALAGRLVVEVRGSHRAALYLARMAEAAGLDPGWSLVARGPNEPGALRLGSSRRRLVGGRVSPAPFFIERPHARSALPNVDVLAVGASAQAPFDDTPAARAPGPVAAPWASYSGKLFVDARWACHLGDRAATLVGTDRDGVDAAAAPWWAAAAPAPGGTAFDLYAGGSAAGRFVLPDVDEGAAADAVLALAVAAEALGIRLEAARRTLAQPGSRGAPR